MDVFKNKRKTIKSEQDKTFLLEMNKPPGYDPRNTKETLYTPVLDPNVKLTDLYNNHTITEEELNYYVDNKEKASLLGMNVIA